MNGRRYYVISGGGEQGPFSDEELRESLAAGAIRGQDRVRSAMGTALGTVAQVLTRSGGQDDADSDASAARPARGSRALPIAGLLVVLVLVIVLWIRSTSVTRLGPAGLPDRK